MNTSSSSSNKRTETDRHSISDDTASPPPPSKRTKSAVDGNDPTTTTGTITTATSTSSAKGSTGSGSSTNAQDLSKIPREALERIALINLKNNVDKEAISILKEEQEKVNKFDEEKDLIPKLPSVEADEILKALHKSAESGSKEATEAISLLKKSYKNQKIRDDFLNKKDIWLNVMSFVGPGNYIFVAGVCKNLKKFYGEYVSTLGENELPEVWLPYNEEEEEEEEEDRKLLLMDTFHREAFVSLSRAKFWDENTKQKAHRLLRNDYICQTIATYGDVPTLKWARKQRGFPWDADTCAQAAAAGNMEILKYAHDNGCEWDTRTCTVAANRGRLDILQYAHDNGCPWDSTTCNAAAGRGHLHVLQYARDNGCPWSYWTLLNAIRNGHQEIVEYARANGCPEPPPNENDN